MEYVGEYVSELRGLRGLNQAQLAEKIGVHERTVRNLETAKHEPKPSDLDTALAFLQGSWAHVAQLMRPGATLDLARRLAHEAFSGVGFTEEQRLFLENLTPEQKKTLLDVARQMRKP
jgi:transcriptional regulator with XRE-family HTH domain